RELAPIGPEPAVAELDLERAQGPEYQALTEEIEKRYGRLDGLLHNAGVLGRVRGLEVRHRGARAGARRRAREHADPRELDQPGRDTDGDARAGVSGRESRDVACAGRAHAALSISARPRR